MTDHYISYLQAELRERSQTVAVTGAAVWCIDKLWRGPK